MQWTGAIRWFRVRQQPVVAAFLALCVLAASLGIPVVVEPQHETSQPYPCMHHRCGCTSADACWHGCCCMTLGQKLAWAKKNGIAPPDYVLVLAETPTSSCGSCGHHDHDEDSSLCDDHNSSPSESAESAEESGRTIGLVLVHDFRRCQGLGSLWLTLAHALPPKVETSVAQFSFAPSEWLRVTSQTADSLALSPATPPPRHSFS
jgi:hypothetical protein